MSSTSSLDYKDIPKKYIDPLAPKPKDQGARVNGKSWKMQKDAYRVKSIGVRKLDTYKARDEKRKTEQQYKQRLQDLKQEKEDAKKAKIEESKRRKEIKAEKERYELMAEKMHRKKVERLRKKEKRNKLLKER